MEKVSLYIPCYNAERFIKKCLDGVINQSYKIDEILIIDDGSTDKTIDIVKNYPVRIITHRKNKGLAAARNAAFKEAKNEFVASLDADCIANVHWLQRVMESFVSEDIVGAGGMLKEKNILNVADRWRSIHMAQHWGNEIINDPPYLYGNNTVFKKSCIEKVGFYQEVLKNNYEDVDLSIRIYNKGLRLSYNPHAFVEHIRTDTVRSIITNYWKRYYFYQKSLIDRKTVFQRIATHLGNVSDYTEISEVFFQEDLNEKNYKLLLLDCFFAFYCLWLDLKHRF